MFILFLGIKSLEKRELNSPIPILGYAISLTHASSDRYFHTTGERKNNVFQQTEKFSFTVGKIIIRR